MKDYYTLEEAEEIFDKFNNYIYNNRDLVVEEAVRNFVYNEEDQLFHIGLYELEIQWLEDNCIGVYIYPNNGFSLFNLGKAYGKDIDNLSKKELEKLLFDKIMEYDFKTERN